ncbi:MAG: DUF975 domain-containing protein [Waterburya sp.]
MNPLSVGNVVSAGLRIYRDNFKKYFKLAFFGYLWIFVPVYGWAKYSAMMGLISRLAFREVSEQPEAIKDAQRHIKPKMWNFLAAGLVVGLIFLGTVIPYFIVVTIFFGIIGAILGQSTAATGIIILLTVIAILLFIFGFIWLISRLFMVDMPIAVEENTNPVSAISRSFQLTKGSVSRIQLVVFLAFLISAPSVIVINIVSLIIVGIILGIFVSILQLVIGIEPVNGYELGTELGKALGFLFYPMLIAGVTPGDAFMIPFWQGIKAVVYYDLRVRREGMGIDLRK